MSKIGKSVADISSKSTANEVSNRVEKLKQEDIPRESYRTKEGMLAMAKKAFGSNAILLFLSGIGEYACPPDRSVPANIPTNFERVVSLGIHALYCTNKDQNIIGAYKNAIIDLLNGNAEQIWIAFSICWSQLYKEKTEKSPFTIMTEEFLLLIKDKFNKSKDDLSSLKIWQGSGKLNGLWQDMIQGNSVLISKFGVSLL